MFSGNFFKSSAFTGRQDGNTSSHANQQPPQPPPRATSSPDLPLVTSDLQDDVPVAAVTSDLPEFNPERTQAPTQAENQTDTPRGSRIEIVLNVSPHKFQPGHTLWSEADLDELEDELAGPSTASPVPKKRRRTAGRAAATNSPAAVTKRPRGRPKGWRPGMPSTKTGKPTASAHRYLDQDGNPIPRTRTTPAAAKSASTGNGAAPKRRGRPPRPPSPTPRVVWETMEPPRYVAFRCEWATCKAELQNGETLRRHLRKVHGVGAGALVCHWGHCGRGAEQDQGQTRFEDQIEALAHVNERHLLPFAWHVGDGHRNGKRLIKEPAATEEDEIPAYLLGPDGAQVTPWVKEQKVEDMLTRRENRRRLRAILLQRDANAPFEEDPEGYGVNGERRDADDAA